MFYDNFRAVCKENKTTLTSVLKSIGRSTGSTGRWKDGTYPSLDIVMEIADFLGVSLDELVYGQEKKLSTVSESELEWLDIINHIPADKQQMCKDFLKTHMVVPDKYVVRKKG